MTIDAQRGSSLIELMIAVALGLVVSAGNFALFQATLQNSRGIAAGKQLEGELHSTLDLITRDLRRIGAMGNPLRQLVGVGNPFNIDAPASFAGETTNSCLTYSYDLNGNGSLDVNPAASDERLGYRLRQGAVQSRGSGSACASSSGWSTVTTPAVVQVTDLQFTIVSTTNLGITERVVTVNIAGRLVSNGAVARSFSRTVRLRNEV